VTTSSCCRRQTLLSVDHACHLDHSNSVTTVSLRDQTGREHRRGPAR
jgi:hypothetical protein